jgi:hypothetical protein
MEKRTMTRMLFVLGFLAAAAGLASGQIWMDDFSYANGTTIGSWQEFNGDWQALNNEARCEAKSVWQYLTQPNRIYQDCCVQCKVIATGSSLSFGGVTLRCSDPGNGSLGQDLIMAKLQGSGSYAQMWLYSLDPTGARVSNSGSTPSSPTGTIRLLVIDQRVVAHADTTGDGIWDLTLTHTTNVAIKAGPVGLDGYNGPAMDDFLLWDGVIMDDAASPAPKPGVEVKFNLRGFANAPYQAASSLANSGIVLPDGRIIPLAADTLFLTSVINVLPTVFKNYSNVMDGSGNATISLAIPNIPALTGLTIYTAFVNYSGATILNISNDHQTTIQ